MSEDIKELVKRLRAWNRDVIGADATFAEAADALEAMAGEVAQARATAIMDIQSYDILLKRAEAAEAERDKWHGKSNEQEDRADMAIAERDRLAGEAEALRGKLDACRPIIKELTPLLAYAVDDQPTTIEIALGASPVAAVSLENLRRAVAACKGGEP